MNRRTACSAFTILLMVATIADHANADDQGDAYAAIQHWAEAFNAGDLNKITAGYSPSALLFGTASPTLTSNPQDVAAYFKGAFANKTQVKLGEYKATAIAPGSVAVSGLYEFSRPGTDGQTINLPSRYSFVLAKQDAAWLIVNHHSSLQPRPPAPPK